MTSLLVGCSFYWDQFGPELRLYDGPTREPSEVATIIQAVGCYTCIQSISRIDEKEPLYSMPPAGWEPVGSGIERPKKIFVLPGRYVVALNASDVSNSSGNVDLLAGHVYQVKNDILSNFNKEFVWMEDEGSGEVLLGERL